MRTHLTRWMAVCGLVVAAATASLAVAQSAGEIKPVAIVAFAGYDELMKDINFIGDLGDQKGASDNIEQLVQMFTQGKGLAGFDKAKPVGVLIQTDGAMPSGALCLPVSDLNALLDVAKGFGVTTTDMGNDVIQIKSAQGASLFAKKSGAWALLSMAPAMLEGLPADPGAEFAALVNEYDIAAKVMVKNLPEAQRQQAIEAMSQGAQQGLKKEPNESDAAYAERKKMVDAQLEQMKEFINDLDEVTVGVKVDGEQQKVFADFAYTALPNTKLAEAIAASSDAKTNFAGFFKPEAAVNLSFASKMTSSDSAQLGQMVETLRTQVTEQIEKTEKIKSPESKAKAKAALEDFLAALKATLEAGVTDGGASLELSPDSLSLIAGGFIADPAKVEAGLKKLAEVGEAEKAGDMPTIKWAADKQGDVTFHTLTRPIPEDEDEARQMLGDELKMVVGVGKKAVYFALGREPMAAVKSAIDASSKSPNKAIAPFELTVGLAQILDVAKTTAPEDKKEQLEEISAMLNDSATGRDHVRMVGQPIENGIRMRLELEEGVLRAIGMAAQQAKLQAAGAGGGGF